MPRNLVIVESPAKAKTIEKYLGPDYQVESSFGHIRDLPETGLGVDVDQAFAPQYIVSSGKKEVVAKLRKLAKQAETVWLASDEDREGEAIAWHLAEALDLDPKTTRRIVFHEITKTAIVKAIENPRNIDQDLVNAQQARRVMDRLVGFQLSPVLWKKVRKGLSAGRVQSVAVRLIVDREREVQRFQSTSDYRTVAQFVAKSGQLFSAECKHRFAVPSEAESFVMACHSKSFVVGSVETHPGKRTPAAPFTTSTLQQEASRKLGFSVSRTMSVAQGLYESGLITYMRTDSVNLSQDALASLEESIGALYGSKYHKRRTFTTKSKGAQEAHEAIRPSQMDQPKAGLDPAQKKLYELIWKRTVASQMADAVLERTTAEISAQGLSYPFTAQGEVLTFDGFLKVYREDTDDESAEEQSGLLPALHSGQSVPLAALTSTERYSRPPARYTEASLVKKLEELGIGRPSTYAPTITTIVKRGYVQKGEAEGVERKYRLISLQMENGLVASTLETEKTGSERGKLLPTDIGTVVTDFLSAHFSDIMDYAFTARMEEDFDLVAEGKVAWTEVLKDFYQGFHKAVNDSNEVERASGERILGVHPSTGLSVSARVARYGPVVMIAAVDEDSKPRFASIPPALSLETITLEQALGLFALPRSLGEFEDKNVVASAGRFGPYLQHNSKFVTLPKDISPYDVTLEQAIDLIYAKREAEAKALLDAFDTPLGHVSILQGRFGPYMKLGKDNFKISKGTDPEKLTEEQVVQWITEQKAAPKSAKKRFTKKK